MILKNNTCAERFEYARKQLDVSYRELGELFEVTSDAVNKSIKRDSIKPKYINTFSDKYGISKEWLINGEGEMFKKDYPNQNESSHHILKEPSGNYNKGVPYFDVEFTAGFLEVTENQSIKPDSYIDHPFFKGCDYVVRASGQSMAKVICHGDAIGLVKINNWREFFPFGEIYAIVTNDGFRMVKIITKGDTNDSYTLISKPTDSKKDEFPPQQIKKTSIAAIFKVQASSHLF